MKNAMPKESSADKQGIEINITDPLEAERFRRKFGNGSKKFESWLDSFLRNRW